MTNGEHAGRRGAADASGRSPFVRLTELLGDAKPGKPLINLSVGEPRHPIPAFVEPVLREHNKLFGKYPMSRGTDRFRAAAADWLGRRYKLARPVDPVSEVIVLNGSREGLFLAAIAARRYLPASKNAVLLPNPFYAAYGAGAEVAGCEPIALSATRERGFVPDYEAIPDDLFARTAVIFVCSPANPQGSVVPRASLEKLVARARKHGALVFADECYSDIWLKDEAPAGVLEAAGNDFKSVVAFHSLSKRSSLPGLRCGFAAGDKSFLAAFMELRNVAAPQVPEPVQEVAVTAYSDEAHVAENRRLYRAKFDLADRILGKKFNYQRPEGGFFLWLDVSKFRDDESATLKLFREAGLRVVPGSYLARPTADGNNPGAGYIRAALVDDLAITEEALKRFAEIHG